jgi:hypothetical protein
MLESVLHLRVRCVCGGRKIVSNGFSIWTDKCLGWPMFSVTIRCLAFADAALLSSLQVMWCDGPHHKLQGVSTTVTVMLL